ncbi:MAG: hypothetical protein LBV16_02865 [Elusimicrobiota bacterium]|jgi:purine-nucleoside phosphorylase|nr:hypothetical protein [Elusimicrobiota bacterium]
MNFKDFFAISPNSVQKNCIICNSLDIALFSDQVKNGLFVKTSEIENATVIALKNNFLAGDIILYLKQTQCENIILFGGCGGCGDINSGDMIVVDKAYNLESFSKMLTGKDFDYIEADKKLSEEFCKQNGNEKFIKTNSACVGSLLLESKYINWFKENNICALDMESSIIFCAAKEIGMSFAAFMYIADHIEKNPFGTLLDDNVKMKLASARKKLSKMIMDFVK